MARRANGSARFTVLAVLTAVLAGGLGVFKSMDDRPPTSADAQTSTPSKPATIIGRQRPDFTLPDVDGQPRSISEWDGSVVLINFWATWCAPCREEMPLLIEMQTMYEARGYKTLGIAVDEPERATAFADKLGVNYPSLFSQRDVIELSKRYGNLAGVLPYTVIIDHTGVVRFTHLGLVERESLVSLLDELLSATQ
ncbi:MAG: peroxiredoxin [Gammaproteobacteria bacterium]